MYAIPENSPVNSTPPNYKKKLLHRRRQQQQKQHHKPQSSWQNKIGVLLALVTVTTLSITGVWIGMRYASITQQNQAYDAAFVPRTSPHIDTSVSDGTVEEQIIDSISNDIMRNDNTNDDITPSTDGENDDGDEDVDTLTDNEISNKEESIVSETAENNISENTLSTQSQDEDKSDNDINIEDDVSEKSVEDVEALSIQLQDASDNDITDIFTQPRSYYNKDTSSTVTTSTHSSKFPRIITLQGELHAESYNLRGSSDDREKRTIHVSKKELKEQERLLDSDDFSYRDPLYEGDCVPMQPWQETSFPNCNLFHELDFYGKSLTDEFEYYTSGGYNDIFYLDEQDKKDDPDLAMKILQYGTEYTDRNYDRVRRDGLILERLTKSPYVLATYGFCGFDVLTPYAGGGTLSSHLRDWRRGKIQLTDEQRLQLAYEVAAGLAAVHDIDGEGSKGLSAVAHGDLKGQQYLFLNGQMKLGDFNRGRFIRRNSTAPDTACTYTIGKNDAAFRSPEEYEYLPQSSAIDIYAVGSLLYEMLTGNEVWHDTSMKDAQRAIRRGERPKIRDDILKSTHPVDVAFRDAIDMCWVFDPTKRAKANEVAAFLQQKLRDIKTT